MHSRDHADSVICEVDRRSAKFIDNKLTNTLNFIAYITSTE